MNSVPLAVELAKLAPNYLQRFDSLVPHFVSFLFARQEHILLGQDEGDLVIGIGVHAQVLHLRVNSCH